MMKLESDIARLGGIAATRELLQLGHSQQFLRLYTAYGRTLIRVRKGWYATSDVDPEVIRAWRLGGRLAGVSAAIHWGIVDGPSPLLHVSLNRQASRLRSPDRLRVRLSDETDPRVVLHWSREAPSGTRQSVSAETATAQMAACFDLRQRAQAREQRAQAREQRRRQPSTALQQRDGLWKLASRDSL
jgi:hypothetical protein